MFRTVFWILLLLGLVWGVYYYFSDFELNWFSNSVVDEILNDVSETGDVQDMDESSMDTGAFFQTGIIYTGSAIYTGSIDTGSLLELEYILDNDGVKSGDIKTETGNDDKKHSESTGTVTSQPSTQNTNSNRSSNKSNSLSEKDMRDMKNLFDAVGVE